MESSSPSERKSPECDEVEERRSFFGKLPLCFSSVPFWSGLRQVAGPGEE
jgi:hypothetical protein